MEIRKTISSIFLAPTLNIGSERMLDNNLINAYIDDVGADFHYENALYLLFQPKSINRFKNFLEEEYERDVVIDDYDIEGGYVVVIYALDMKWKEDFEKIKKGRYSHTSPEFQELFPKTKKMVEHDPITKRNKMVEKLSLQYRIFNKTDDLREYWEDKIAVSFKDSMELWEGWDESLEVLDITKLRK